ncbi:unnamed protein product [Angiostrongylus costaricensis]|uniref:Ephrin RBD domain-containing protein n=1 Tax=Angiostrongylus costaricensis TaxID=334426 RepID=A0A158PLJ1_ANGCS|nr:unnamed protein product [Angiostrongylus costaricensis]
MPHYPAMLQEALRDHNVFSLGSCLSLTVIGLSAPVKMWKILARTNLASAPAPSFCYPVGSSNTIVVDMDDTIRVICPGINAWKRYLKIHKVSALSFSECLLETQKTLIATCDGSSRSEKPTIVSVRRFSRLPSSQAILFEPGETYYWIATSTGERDGIDQTQRGMCAADNMRLVIHVREYSKESSPAIPRTTTSRAVQRDPSSRQYGSESDIRYSKL